MTVNPYLFAGNTPDITVTRYPGAPPDYEAVARAIQQAGHVAPSPAVVERFTAITTTTLTFPRPHPTFGDPVAVTDQHWRHRAVTCSANTLAWIGRDRERLYLDLRTGRWLVFTPRTMPATMTRPYISPATTGGIPEGATGA